MAKLVKGIYNCEKDGEFEWITFILNGTCDNIFGNLNKINKNCLDIKKNNNGYNVVLRCPKCGKRYNDFKKI